MELDVYEGGVRVMRGEDYWAKGMDATELVGLKQRMREVRERRRRAEGRQEELGGGQDPQECYYCYYAAAMHGAVPGETQPPSGTPSLGEPSHRQMQAQHKPQGGPRGQRVGLQQGQ